MDEATAIHNVVSILAGRVINQTTAADGGREKENQMTNTNNQITPPGGVIAGHDHVVNVWIYAVNGEPEWVDNKITACVTRPDPVC